MPYLAKGTIALMEVVDHSDHEQPLAPALQADMTVKLRDFVFPLPSEIKAGSQVWQIVNEGSQPHEIELVKLAEGKAVVAAACRMPNSSFNACGQT